MRWTSQSFWVSIAAATLTILLTGCATSDTGNYRQAILVQSDPPGAEIFAGNEKLGVTPAYVRVRRGKAPQIRLEEAHQPPRTLTLKTHYRWGDSFAANLILFTAAPMGWAIDWMTGTAWKLDDPPVEKFAGAGKVAEDSAPQVVAVAPPAGEDSDTADALGSVIENKLRSNQTYHLLPYDKTAPVFGYYSSDHGISEKPTDRNDLFYELKADHIFVSRVESNADGFIVRGRLRDVYSGHEGAEETFELTPSDGTERSDLGNQRKIRSYFHFLPNTLFLNLSQFNASLSIDQTNYEGKSARGQGFSEKALDYLSAVSLAHLERPRDNVRGHWIFAFVPTFIASDKRIKFEDYAPLRDTDFNRWYISGGYGIELGHQSRIGLFYLDYIPMVTWTELTFHTEQFDESLSRTTITSMSELGYSYFFSSHLIGKIFVRQLGEDVTLWRKAVHDITGQNPQLDYINSSFAGIAIGYYIPASLSLHRGWSVKDKR